MEYNECDTCGAKDGRAGKLYGRVGSDVAECENCYNTRSSGEVCINAMLSRTDDEIKRTMDILNIMKTFKVEDSFNITGRGVAYNGQYFEGFKELLGTEVLFEGKVNGKYLIKEVGQCTHGIMDTGKTPPISFIAERVEPCLHPIDKIATKKLMGFGDTPIREIHTCTVCGEKLDEKGN